MSSPARDTVAGLDLTELDAICDAVASGSGLPEVVRAAARSLDASLILCDRTGAVLAVATRSSAEERALLTDGGDDVDIVELRVGDAQVGTLRMRTRSESSPSLVRVVSTLVASEVERVRAPQRASQEATTAFIHEVLSGQLDERAELVARAGEVGLDLEDGATAIVARAHALAPAEEGWRARVLAAAERGARAV
jgi:hypothetical protein